MELAKIPFLLPEFPNKLIYRPKFEKGSMGDISKAIIPPHGIPSRHPRAFVADRGTATTIRAALPAL